MGVRCRGKYGRVQERALCFARTGALEKRVRSSDGQLFRARKHRMYEYSRLYTSSGFVCILGVMVLFEGLDGLLSTTLHYVPITVFHTFSCGGEGFYRKKRGRRLAQALSFRSHAAKLTAQRFSQLHGSRWIGPLCGDTAVCPFLWQLQLARSDVSQLQSWLAGSSLKMDAFRVPSGARIP